MTYTIFVNGKHAVSGQNATVTRGDMEFYQRSGNDVYCIDARGQQLTLSELEQRIAATTQLIRQ
jgi:hypothetical protein